MLHYKGLFIVVSLVSFLMIGDYQRDTSSQDEVICKERPICKYCSNSGKLCYSFCRDKKKVPCIPPKVRRWIICPNCCGKGIVRCIVCCGSGRDRCIVCNDTGREECVVCNGTGVNSYTGEGCFICSSKGFTPCMFCEGRGGLPCRSCCGKGFIRCRPCCGTGYIYRPPYRPPRPPYRYGTGYR